MGRGVGKWSKFQQQLESRFAACLIGRLRIRSVAYRRAHDSAGRAYFELDGKELGNFCELSAFVHRCSNVNELCHPNARHGRWTKPIDSITPGALHEPGEFSQNDFYASCATFLDMPVAEALKSANPIILALAIVDSRCGKRRLDRLKKVELPPIAAALLAIRCAAMGE